MKSLMLLAAAAALTAGAGLPAWSALRVAGQAEALAALAQSAGPDAPSGPLILAEDDGHTDEGGSASRAVPGDDDGECDDDGSCGAAAAPPPAPAGTVAPPQNGLFDTSAAPKATVK